MILKKFGGESSKGFKKAALKTVATVLGVALMSGSIAACSESKTTEETDADVTTNQTTEGDETTASNQDDDIYGLSMSVDGNGGDSKGDIDMPINDSDTFAIEGEVPDAASSWTVLVYMCGSNLESGNGFGSYVMNRMNDMESSDNVNVIVETGGTEQWVNKTAKTSDEALAKVDIPADALGRYQIKKDEVIDLGSVELDSMGKSSTLSDFISWGKENYPAKKYMLVLWNHGYVEPYGNLEADDIFYKDVDGNVIYYQDVPEDAYLENDCIDLDELSQALKDGGTHFESIVFNTCLSSSLEIAKSVAPYANYMVSSEESIPCAIGIPEQYIAYLNANPDCSGKDVGKFICEMYSSALLEVIDIIGSDSTNAGNFTKATMACIDLSAVDEMWTCYTDITKHLYYSIYDMDSYTGFLNASANCENYGSSANVEGNLIDLKAFLMNASNYLTDTDSDEKLISLIDENIIAMNGPARSNSYGMSIYFPSYNYLFNYRASLEGELIANNIPYTEEQLDEFIKLTIKDVFDGYINNIDNYDEYFWYAAYLDYRLGEYWGPEKDVQSLIDGYVEPVKPEPTPEVTPEPTPEVTPEVTPEPTETEPTETTPAETEPVETTVETEPTETEPVETTTEPTETTPAETEPVETEPSETTVEPTETKETEPSETEPVETEPVETTAEPEPTAEPTDAPKPTNKPTPTNNPSGHGVIDQAKFKMEYETWVGDDGNFHLNITKGGEAVISVRQNLTMKLEADNQDLCNFYYNYFGSTNRGMVKDENGEYYNESPLDWFYFGSYPVPAYTIEHTDTQSIYGFRAEVNEEKCIIVFRHDVATDECEFLYACRVEETTGLASNDIFPIQEGDEVGIMFFTYTAGDDTDSFADWLLIRPLFKVEYTADTKIFTHSLYGSNTDLTYDINYTIIDAFGNIYYTDFVEYEVVAGQIVRAEEIYDVPEAVTAELYGVV